MGLVPTQNAPSSKDAERELGVLHDEVIPQLQELRSNQLWRVALVGLADEVMDVIIPIRRLAVHERVWRESWGTKPSEPPIFDDPNQNTMQQMARARADLRSFVLLIDVLLDDAAKALRPLGASRRATESFRALARHLEQGGSDWSKPLLPLTREIVGLQFSIGYFRDKFVAHRGHIPLGGVYLPDGRVRLMLIGGTFSEKDLVRGGREAAALMPVPDNPLDPVYDVRLDIAFAGLKVADPERRKQLAGLLEEFGAVSPDPYETAIEVSEVISDLFRAMVSAGSD
jgi:hypothetical protein